MESYRIHTDASVYFITCSVVSWLPIFIDAAPCEIVTDSLNHCHNNKHLRIAAYVIMPTHLHLILFDADHDSERMSRTLHAFRKHTGRTLSDYCADHFPPAFNDVLYTNSLSDRTRRFWQPTRHPVAIEGAQFYQQKLDYLHANPIRKGLVRYPEDWRFSSARYYQTGNPADSDVHISQLRW
jgi:REP element-mobilizing transposase RayT